MDVLKTDRPSFTADRDTEFVEHHYIDIEAEMKKLDLVPGSILVVKTRYPDVDTTAAIEQVVQRPVLSIDLESDVCALVVGPSHTVFIMTGLDYLGEGERAVITTNLKMVTGCKSVVFLPRGTGIASKPE